MPQIFPRSANTIARASIVGVLLGMVAILAVAFAVVRSPYTTQVAVAREQPIPFSHAHHVGDVGIDCRYCHSSVEDSSFAGMPSTDTCMNCHSQLWAESEMLEPVRESYRTGEPLQWVRVHNLPDFAYFDHSIHVQKGIGCVTCHGQVDQMPLMWKNHSLQMKWCLDCHRHPEEHIRPPAEVFSMDWQPPEDRDAMAAELIEQLGVESKTDCYACHR